MTNITIPKSLLYQAISALDDASDHLPKPNSTDCADVADALTAALSKAETAEPLFWVRLRSDGGYELPIHDKAIEDVRRTSGAWSPLYLGAAPVQQAETAEPVAWADKIAFESAMQAGKGCDVWPRPGDYEQRTGRKLVALYRTPVAQQPQEHAEQQHALAEPPHCEPQHAITEEGWCEWVCPKPKGYLFQCCDCGLVHEMDFRVAQYEPQPSEEFAVSDNPDLQCQFRARRVQPVQQAETAEPLAADAEIIAQLDAEADALYEAELYHPARVLRLALTRLQQLTAALSQAETAEPFGWVMNSAVTDAKAGWVVEVTAHKEADDDIPVYLAPVAQQPQERTKQILLNLLARIHGDGGQYVDEVGIDCAAEAADALVAEWRAQQPKKPRKPLTEAQAAELLGLARGVHFDNALADLSLWNLRRIKLVQLGWNAAHGIGEADHG